MGSMHCRLYDENLVHNIIMSAAMEVVEYLKKHRNADSGDVCEYIESHTDTIIEDTINQLNESEELSAKDNGEDPWPPLPGELDEES